MQNNNKRLHSLSKASHLLRRVHAVLAILRSTRVSALVYANKCALQLEYGSSMLKHYYALIKQEKAKDELLIWLKKNAVYGSVGWFVDAHQDKVYLAYFMIDTDPPIDNALSIHPNCDPQIVTISSKHFLKDVNLYYNQIFFIHYLQARSISVFNDLGFGLQFSYDWLHLKQTENAKRAEAYAAFVPSAATPFFVS